MAEPIKSSYKGLGKSGTTDTQPVALVCLNNVSGGSIANEYDVCLDNLFTMLNREANTSNIVFKNEFIAEKFVISLKLLLTPIHPDLAGEILVDTGNNDAKIGQYLQKQIERYSLGTIDLTSRSNNYKNYPPYCKYYIYLPFVGVREIDGARLLKNPAYLYASVDYLTGDIHYFITSDTEYQYSAPGDPSTACWERFSGNCSLSIPISYNDTERNKKEALLKGGLAIGATALSLASGNMGIAAMTAISGGISLAKDLSAAEGGNLLTEATSNAGFVDVPYACVLIEKQDVVEPANYAHYIGKPLFEQKTLSALQGYTKVADIHLHDVIATKEEIDEIETLLRQGVILP